MIKNQICSPFSSIDLQENKNNFVWLGVDENDLTSRYGDGIDEGKGRSGGMKCNAGSEADCQV